MKTNNAFDTLQTLFVQDLQELRQLRKRGWFVLPMSRIVKEEHIGRCCFMAEEFLDSEELNMLKRELGFNERQWNAYKAKISQ
ncbi:hypothetical protein [Dictyobacter aurantiacus]|uniref:Uncharacterized protein n=1 Tax=Dictyobacter aurantiacus TaxID=1936993 RepID=A0A401ZPL6_9CHLR|nr:hypothetical protein [Dictyobacter aurantiacus]GCE08848.1 hypothetical protein KDAU_61770 [Dictyobacter aurantiacus]